jgi:hypothetical protein
MTMPFGKFKGWALAELPDDYLRWLVSLDDLREPLRSAVVSEWTGRFRGPSTGALVPIPSEAVPVADALVTAGYRALALQHHPGHRRRSSDDDPRERGGRVAP